jgi:hypothetical protein
MGLSEFPHSHLLLILPFGDESLCNKLLWSVPIGFPTFTFLMLAYICRFFKALSLEILLSIF